MSPHQQRKYRFQSIASLAKLRTESSLVWRTLWGGEKFHFLLSWFYYSYISNYPQISKYTVPIRVKCETGLSDDVGGPMQHTDTVCVKPMLSHWELGMEVQRLGGARRIWMEGQSGIHEILSNPLPTNKQTKSNPDLSFRFPLLLFVCDFVGLL